ncbi:MAG TPA: response regulator [Dongiaceae bacterium]|nr:response regulator [Dongiaceae bacterium]
MNENTTQKLVWLIDDDETTLILAEDVLTAHGFSVRTFPNAPGALEAIGAGWPDIIVTDLLMPGMDGFEFCAHLRAIPGGQLVPILVTTSLEDTPSIERAYKEGATGFATKPLNWASEVHHLRFMMLATDTARALQRQTQALEEQIAAKEKAHAALSEMHEQLVEASRKAGMAEVAAGVLHNIGNVLNSINVSATLLRDNLRTSKVIHLAKVSGLMQEHNADLAGFLTTDPKGKLVPPFIIQLADLLQQEHTALQKEYDLLTTNIEHIKAVVTVQQGYARMSGRKENVSLSRLADDTLQINLAGLTRHGIKIVRHYGQAPAVLTDKHSVLQILVNLVRNAQLALAESPRPDKVLVVGIGLGDDRHVQVSVTDNGVGIPPENLAKIFTYGFTTRKDGHGFGLHSGLKAATDLGGRLHAHSDGPGQGAKFTLELPLSVEDHKNRHSQLV